MGERNYPLNCWWVAALSEEIGREPIGRLLLDMPILLYRAEDNEVVALDNRCPHRGAPLSMGKLDRDDIVCGYHGFRFDRQGQCVGVPSQDRAPRAVKVRSYRTVEQAPFVWIYLGDEARIDTVPVPYSLAWMDEPGFAAVSGYMDIRANYMLLKENVLDLTHFGYVHAASFGITDWNDPPGVEVDGDVVTYRQEFRDNPLAPIYAVPIGVEPGKHFDRDNYGSFVSPALQIAAVDFHDPAPAAGERSDFRLRICHATTPAGPDRMHYWWVFARDHGTTPELMKRLRADVLRGFAEDEAIILAVQELTAAYPFTEDQPEVSVKADTAAIQARRAMARWMERESR